MVAGVKVFYLKANPHPCVSMKVEGYLRVFGDPVTQHV